MFFWEVVRPYRDISRFYNYDDLIDSLFDPYEYHDEVDVDTYLDNVYGSIVIDGIEFYASNILENMANNQYYELRNRIAEGRAKEDLEYYQDQLKSMMNGKSIHINDSEITYYETKDEDESPAEVTLQEFNKLLHTNEIQTIL